MIKKINHLMIVPQKGNHTNYQMDVVSQLKINFSEHQKFSSNPV